MIRDSAQTRAQCNILKTAIEQSDWLLFSYWPSKLLNLVVSRIKYILLTKEKILAQLFTKPLA